MTRAPHGRARVRELVSFGAVGTAALAVHWLVVALLVPRGAGPLAANAVAFVVAFGVSFGGHARWSFPATGRPLVPALVKFAAVAVGGFALNEVAYAALLAWTSLDYRLALLFVLAAVAVVTFVAGRCWAFAIPGVARGAA